MRTLVTPRPVQTLAKFPLQSVVLRKLAILKGSHDQSNRHHFRATSEGMLLHSRPNGVFQQLRQDVKHVAWHEGEGYLCGSWLQPSFNAFYCTSSRWRVAAPASVTMIVGALPYHSWQRSWITLAACSAIFRGSPGLAGGRRQAVSG